MNVSKLAQAEFRFLTRYPRGFADPQMASIKKKHNVDALVRFTQENLTKTNCLKAQFVADTVLKIINRSSMVSRFEKPQFRHFINALDSNEKETLAYAFEQRLYGRKQVGFDLMCGLLAHHKLAKWAVVSVVPFYFAPRREVFVKPTTAKGIIAFLEVEDLHYQSSPSWAFYKGYQKLVGDVKKAVRPSLSPNNAALTGFLMMTMDKSAKC